ncbi:hypothetical protein [Escherichia coli]|uniref:hypothetical protein n=1 Tax=Escherichia coli TaxID=562 RepID=UPI0013D7BD93|nr:hypothetical protein [Escherichia coli]EFH1083568.1 hypothetical protein [Escherichia coli]EJD9520406.1 hypothetical protein [Escherichia coli]MDY9503184.1 hypothetical protein [Escherichia coli]NGK52331.1 hypothetical protein [Escherichia coli]HBD5441608.1 hypothetical protein [Escherichia coli]
MHLLQSYLNWKNNILSYEDCYTYANVHWTEEHLRLAELHTYKHFEQYITASINLFDINGFEPMVVPENIKTSLISGSEVFLIDENDSSDVFEIAILDTDEQCVMFYCRCMKGADGIYPIMCRTYMSQSDWVLQDIKIRMLVHLLIRGNVILNRGSDIQIEGAGALDTEVYLLTPDGNVS